MPAAAAAMEVDGCGSPDDPVVVGEEARIRLRADDDGSMDEAEEEQQEFEDMTSAMLL